MDKPISTLEQLPAQAPNAPGEREAYVAQLRERYLDGSLDEILIPQEAEVPDSLLSALFPHLFPEARKNWKH
ncbi:MAG: hypothetical protein VX899_12340 [Myxococcota bacterium]|nr:hypothetical protein [Myxococcota bacterium]